MFWAATQGWAENSANGRIPVRSDVLAGVRILAVEQYGAGPFSTWVPNGPAPYCSTARMRTPARTSLRTGILPLALFSAQPCVAAQNIITLISLIEGSANRLQTGAA